MIIDPTEEWLQTGSLEYYKDPDLYNYDYRNRRKDIQYYTNTLKELSTNYENDVLELGCGTGRIFLPILKQGFKITGIDRSATMLSTLKKRLNQLAHKQQINASLIQANFLKIPLSRKKKFQFIICPFNTFMHLYSRIDSEVFLSQIKSLLIPNGYFLFDVLNPNLEWLCRDPNKRWSKTKFYHPRSKDLLVYTTNHFYNTDSQLLFINIFYKKEREKLEHTSLSQEKRVRLVHRQFFPAELESLLFYNGFILDQRYGDFSKTEFSSNSEQQVIIAKIKK